MPIIFSLTRGQRKYLKSVSLSEKWREKTSLTCHLVLRCVLVKYSNGEQQQRNKVIRIATQCVVEKVKSNILPFMKSPQSNNIYIYMGEVYLRCLFRWHLRRHPGGIISSSYFSLYKTSHTMIKFAKKSKVKVMGCCGPIQ